MKNMKKWAAAEFEPMTEACDNFLERLREPEWSNTSFDLGIQLRLAAGIIGKTKEDVIEMVRSVPEASFEFNEALDGTIIALRAWTELCEMARGRQLSAAAAIALYGAGKRKRGSASRGSKQS